MMGHESPGQDQLFVCGVYLEERVRTNHPLRKIQELADFSCMYNEVKEAYGKVLGTSFRNSHSSSSVQNSNKT